MDDAFAMGTTAVSRVLRRFRREALRQGDRGEAEECLAILWFLHLRWPRKQLGFARLRAQEAPSSTSLVNLGHAYAICGRLPEAEREYLRAIRKCKSAPPNLREFEVAASTEASNALECIRTGRPIPFVERALALGRSAHKRTKKASEK
jgi:hypothetical protein